MFVAMQKRKSSGAEGWRKPELGPCACSQLRRASRAVSAYYDAMLEPVGLTVTQYAILVNIGRAGAVSRSDLAALLGMDRTTATRNLKPLERDGLIGDETGTDRRERQVTLSALGRRKLEEGYVCWSRAQEAFCGALGPEALSTLRGALGAAIQAAAGLGD